MNKIQGMRKALDWLAFSGLDHINWTISVDYNGSLTLSITASKLEEEDRRTVKKLFGPLKAHITEYTRSLQGTRKLDEDLGITVSLQDAYSCEELKPEQVNEAKWNDLRDKIMRGEVKVRDCQPTVGMRAGE